MYDTYKKTNVTFSKPRGHKKRRRVRNIFKILIIIIFIIIILNLAVKYFFNSKSNKLEKNNNYAIDYFYNQKYLNYNYSIISSLLDKDNDSENIDNNELNEYNSIVPESEAVTDDYFNDAVFIGDSRTEGFIMYNGLSNVTSLTSKGLMVDTAFSKPAINMNGEKISVMKALSKTKFNKVYVMLGINELGWAYSDIFINKYAEIVDYIKEINSDAQIYIQSILPVSYEKSTKDKIYNNDKISEYNELIKKMANDKQVYYLDVAEAIKDENGNLPADASLDGVHLKKEYCQKWYDYLKTHTVQNEKNQSESNKLEIEVKDGN